MPFDYPSKAVHVDSDELAGLAQTIATLTRGMVTIEDTGSRVLAYSASGADADELRRLSILGRSGPPAYLELLRTWGVYDRLSGSEGVVEIDEHPETGMRRRLAVGVFAGGEQLGTIWVQQGTEPFPSHAARALLGAARLAAVELAGRGRTSSRDDADQLSALLTGRSVTLEAISPRAARRPCVVAVFVVADDAADRATRALRTTALAGIVRVHAAGLRAETVQAELDGRVYVLLPDVSSAKAAAPMVRAAGAAVRKHVDGAVRAAIGPLAATVTEAAESRRGADLALTVATSATTVFDEARARLAVSIVADAFAQRPDLHDPRLTELAGAEPQLADTLRRYLDNGSDVAAVAAELDIHPTTVRYRLRNAIDRTELDLADPDARLAAHLQLLTGSLHKTSLIG
ncbi:MAG: helix-turn-helix domain-containing protein [Jatrophihabitantaceae bacterium]